MGSGRGAAWLARLLGVQEVPSSNLGGPTKTLHRLTNGRASPTPSLESNWSPKWPRHTGMRVRRSKPPAEGFSLMELLVVIAIILVILAVAVLRVKAARLGVETMVVREVQTIGQAQLQYQSQFGKFAASLPELGHRPAVQPGRKPQI